MQLRQAIQELLPHKAKLLLTGTIISANDEHASPWFAHGEAFG
jgi:predicted hotdog family 3-hydroxylacyl-ACP dehydratase